MSHRSVKYTNWVCFYVGVLAYCPSFLLGRRKERWTVKVDHDCVYHADSALPVRAEEVGVRVCWTVLASAENTTVSRELIQQEYFVLKKRRTGWLFEMLTIRLNISLDYNPIRINFGINLASCAKLYVYNGIRYSDYSAWNL